MNIEIITTADNTVKVTGFGSHSSCYDILESMLRAGHCVRLMVCESLHDLQAVVARKPDLVVLAAKFIAVTNAENIWFSEYFSQHKITFTGSDRETLRFEGNKASAKVHLANMRIKTARHFTAMPNQFLSQSSLPLDFPLFIKSIGAHSYVKNFTEFEAKIHESFLQDKQPVLVEEYIEGRDFKVAIICNGLGEMTVAAVEVLKQGYKQNDTESLLRVVYSKEIHKVIALAKSTFLGLGLRDFAVIDVRMNRFKQCFFMDANLVPNMTIGSSYFLKAFEIANNLSYDQVICLMLDVFFMRARGEKINNEVLKQRNLHWPRALVPGRN